MAAAATPFWDKFSFSYQAIGSEAELKLPLKLLVMGSFSGRDVTEQLPTLTPIQVDLASFDRILAGFRLELSIELLQPTDGAGIGVEFIDIPVNSLQDFEPAQLLRNIPYLTMHLALMRSFQQAAGALELAQFSAAEQQLLRRCGVSGDVVPAGECDFVAMDLNEHLHRLIDSILHDEQFQRIEAIWRGLWQVCQVAHQFDDCEIDILDVSKDVLNEDFLANRDVRESKLFDVVYFNEFAQFGGQPYGAIIADYEFSQGAEDIQLLRSIGQVGYAAHVPFVAGVSAHLFGKDDFSDLGGNVDIAELLSGPRYIKWRNLQQEHWANYLALTLPRIQLRDGYRYPAGQIGLLPYQEDVRLAANKSLLGNASFGFAQCLLRSFGELGICTRICGEEGGRVSSPARVDPVLGSYPIETRCSEHRLAELSARGLMPLTVNSANGEMYFASAYSMRWGGLNQPGWQYGDSLLDMQVEAQLPYLFVVARIAHYLKVVQREALGGLQSKGELETELNRWLRRYVSDVDNPAPGIRMRKPLKQADLRVMTDDEGGLHMELAVTPHMKFQGQDFTLALNLLAD
ncbi:type VI secretion system contractile sheath large subunit [Oceanobacter mangrovi]|uniref:type VI secretion system contractile sheath large subunit n=1 Tax=Oceanobacter mangrovi TaxID=2862510 RepID=UPI001C8EDF1D|nr:type VI secretion system contractile sheath large subunit [Oceanobacter mangrovi]